ncbi:hypothetical protein [Devosia sp. Root685]|uniref:hypothetical protein n=1 Tax=Devosia sp. Root685 TaxID=1736587 RepID=UPI000A461030|nr:hypothetical protein [Devosia sp. Root685]
MQNSPKPDGKQPPRDPALKDVEPGSDADETPEGSGVPPDPNRKQKQEDGNEKS